jgi:hypothetical protein
VNQKNNGNDVIFYSTFFYFPFKIKDHVEIKKDEMHLKNDNRYWKEIPFPLMYDSKDIQSEKALNNQELLYLHYYLSRVMYNMQDEKDEERFLWYYRLYQDGQEIIFDETYKIFTDNQCNGFYLSDLALYIFRDSKIGILSIGVKNNGCSLKDAMEFNMKFRYLYLTHNDQLNNDHLKEKQVFECIKIERISLTNIFDYDSHFVIKDYMPKKINAIIDGLLPFEYKQQYNPVLDHRMLLHTMFCLNKESVESYGYEKGDKGLEYHKDFGKRQAGQEKYKQLFSRILFVDECDDGYYYDSVFIENLIKKHIYTRWLHHGTLYGFCRYADTTVLLGRSEFLENNFRKVYYMMSVLALYYRCALIDFANRSSEVTRDLIKTGNWTGSTDVKKLKEDFLKFSNVWFFRELTNQDQGIEMFNMHRMAYELDELYKGVKEDIEKLDEYIRMKQTKKLNRWVAALTVIAAAIGIFSAIFGFFGMNFEYEWFKKLIGKP